VGVVGIVYLLTNRPRIYGLRGAAKVIGEPAHG